MTIPTWALNPLESVHTVPGEVYRPQPPMTEAQLRATSQFLLDSFVGRIAIAFGAIDIAGWKPLGFLATWGQQRIDDAMRAYLAAMNAQATANFANSQLTILTGGSLASNVPGGVALNDPFTGPSSSSLGSHWSRTSDGSGGGDFGLTGSGHAAWKKFGGLWRRHFDCMTTPLTTDYQAVFVVIAEPVESAQVGIAWGPPAYTYLVCRSNSLMSSFICARIGFNTLDLGGKANGAWFWWKSSTDFSGTAKGDQIVLIAGTSNNVREFIVRQNGVPRLTHTDTTGSLAGSGFRHVGLISHATERNVYLDQTRPAELDTFAAADRLPTTV